MITRCQGVAPIVPEFQLWAASRTSIGLGVKSAIGRVLVFGLTSSTHKEPAHRGIRPVVRQGIDDAEARSAAGAVGERIEVPSVLRIENLSPAFGTRRDVRHYDGSGIPARVAFANRKVSIAFGVEPNRFETLDEASWRLVPLEPVSERIYADPRAFDLEEYPLCGIIDPTR